MRTNMHTHWKQCNSLQLSYFILTQSQGLPQSFWLTGVGLGLEGALGFGGALISGALGAFRLCICACVYTCIYVCASVCAHVYVCVCARVCVCMCGSVHTHNPRARVFVSVCAEVRMSVCVCACVSSFWHGNQTTRALLLRRSITHLRASSFIGLFYPDPYLSPDP